MSNTETTPVTVLLIEDDSVIRMVTASILEDAGYQVVEAPDVDTALIELNTHTEINVVVTDVQMPGVMDGLALVTELKRDRPHIRALVTSGRANLKDAKDCGAAKFLSKPYTAAAIQSAVSELLSDIEKSAPNLCFNRDIYY